jgi:RimJ/RimL family protein N-acetyltransferase
MVLRPPATSDVRRIAELANDPDVARNTTSIPHPYRLADAEAFVAWLVNLDVRRFVILVIEHRAHGPIGMMGLQHIALLPELGYWIGQGFRGQGHATEAVSGALDWSHRGWGRRAVASSHFVDNPASARVLDKAGFLYTGEVERRFSLGRGQEVETRMMVRLA